MSSIEIRNMVPEDVQAVVQIEKDVFSTPWTRQGFFDALSQEQNIFLTAWTDNRIVGYCGMYVAADEGEITNVAVAEDARGRGVGRKLVAEIIRQAAASGVVQIFLEVRRSNQIARNLYESRGFVPQGIRKRFYRLPEEDAVVMICQPDISTGEGS